MTGTPIGNLNDITLRAIETIKEADFIVAEETWSALKIMNRFGIPGKKIIQYSENTHDRKTPEILGLLSEGKNLALISKAGTPQISDPGYRLIREVFKAGFRVLPVPGVSALASALSVSPVDTGRFVFLGFLPRKKGKARRLLQGFSEMITEYPLVIYESPHRIKDTLEMLRVIFGEELNVFYAREMTKIYEEFLYLKIGGLIKSISEKDIKGEITLILSKAES